jgi:hypothetical protein
MQRIEFDIARLLSRHLFREGSPICISPTFSIKLALLPEVLFICAVSRGINIIDGDYLCNGGAEKLILQWKIQHGKWIDE